MSGFGFKKDQAPGRTDDSFDLSGLPKAPVAVDPVREREAVQRGEAIGFTDRETAKVGRRRPPPRPSGTLYIRGPLELIQWFEHYTEEHGHRALWQSIQDFQKLVETKDG